MSQWGRDIEDFTPGQAAQLLDGYMQRKRWEAMLYWIKPTAKQAKISADEMMKATGAAWE